MKAKVISFAYTSQNFRTATLLIAGLAGFLFPSRLQAQMWNSMIDQNWNVAANWTALPVSGPTTGLSVAAFRTGGTQQNLGNPFVLNSLTGWTTINGNPISFAGTNARCESSNNAQINVPLILTVDTSFSGGSFGGEEVYLNGGISGAGKIKVVGGHIKIASSATNTGGVEVEGGRLIVTAVNGLPPTGEIAVIESIYATSISCTAAQTVEQIRMDGESFNCIAGLTVTGKISLRSGLLISSSLLAQGSITKTTTGSASLSNVTMSAGLWNQQGTVDLNGVCSGDILNEANLFLVSNSNVTSYFYNTGTITLDDSILTATLSATNQGDLVLLGNSTLNGSVTNLDSIKVIDGPSANSTIRPGPRTINANVSGAGSLQIDKSVYLNGTNTYAGGTTCNQATVWGTTNGIQGNWTMNDGIIRFTQAADGETAAIFSGTGSIFVNGGNPSSVGGLVTLSGNNIAFTGNVNADGGNFGFGSNSAAGTQSITAGLTQPSELSAANGDRTVATPLLTGGSLLVFSGAKDLTFSDLTPKNITTGTLRHTSAGTTTLGGAFVGQGTSLIEVQAGKLVLGRNQSSGFRTDGTVMVATGATLELLSSNFVKLGVVLLADGTISASNGLVIGSGGTLVGSGTIASRVAMDSGSVVMATGTMQMGDATNYAGFFSQGELQISGSTVTIQDRNQAVLGSLTTLTDDANLAVPNGLFVDVGRAVVGDGIVTSTTSLATAMIINGDAAGESATKRLALQGYVKGLGTFTDVDFLGTFSPGLSPAIVAVNFSSMGSASTLEMELGGTTAGSDYDQLSILGGLDVAGTLKVTLINGFTPMAGQSFQLFEGSSSGSFASLQLPSLSAGLFWHTSQLYSDGLLSVGSVPETYSGFASYHSLTTAASGDEDHDGFSNLLEHALGSNPQDSESPGLGATQFTIDEVMELFSFSMPKPGVSDVVLTIQSSNSLSSWVNLAQKSGKQSWNGAITLLLSPMGSGRERVDLQQMAPFLDKRFYRLHVVLPP